MMAMILHVVVIRVVGWGWASYRSTKWNMKTIESQRSSLEPYWTFLVLTVLQIKDNRHWPPFRGLYSHPSTKIAIQESRDHIMVLKRHLRLTKALGSKKSCHRNQTRDYGARHTVVYDSVLSQQSISGKVVSLILCLWKPSPVTNDL